MSSTWFYCLLPHLLHLTFVEYETSWPLLRLEEMRLIEAKRRNTHCKRSKNSKTTFFILPFLTSFKDQVAEVLTKWLLVFFKDSEFKCCFECL